VSPALWSDLVLLLLVGICWEMVFVSTIQSLQTDVPVAIRGRMVGLFYCVTAGTQALGALLMGWAFTELGVNPGLIALGAVAMACALVLWPVLARARAQLR
jgi:predicted MFS family arabinose efflux permease